MHAGDLFRVIIRHHLAHNAVWIRGEFKLSFEFKFHYIIIIIIIIIVVVVVEGSASRKRDNVRMSPEATWQQKKPRKGSLIN